MQETNWKPTEEELVSLGFVKTQEEPWWVDYMKHRIKVEITFGMDTEIKFHDFLIYPKSIEELRLLISMMNP